MTLLPCSAAEDYGFLMGRPSGNGMHTTCQRLWARGGRAADWAPQRMSTQLQPILCFPILRFFQFLFGFGSGFRAGTKVSRSLSAEQTLNKKPLLPVHVALSEALLRATWPRAVDFFFLGTLTGEDLVRIGH